MSKMLGKIIWEEGTEEEREKFLNVPVKIRKGKSGEWVELWFLSFTLQVFKRVKVKVAEFERLMAFRDVLKWNMGYKYPERKKSLIKGRNELLEEETKGLGLELAMDDVEDLCVIMHVCNISCLFLRRLGKGKNRVLSWTSFSGRGRKKGGKNICSWNEEDEERYRHNLKVAVEKNVKGWYVEAEKEKCKKKGEKFDKKVVEKRWEEKNINFF